MAIIEKYIKTSKNPEHWTSQDQTIEFNGLIKKYIPETNRKKLLDIGCAQGKEVAMFEKMGFKVEGIDIEPRFIQQARKKYSKIKFKIGNVEAKLPYKSGSFDIVFSTNTLCYTDLNKSIPEIHRILKKRGIALVTIDKRMVDLRSKEIMQEQEIKPLKELIKNKWEILYKKKRKRIDNNPFIHKHFYYIIIGRKL